MINNQWLPWLNSSLFGLIAIFILSTAFLSLKGSGEIICSNPEAKECRLPKGAFTLPVSSYIAIGEPVLALKSAPPTVQLPDLRQQLIYYGKNGRPDAQANREVLHFSFNGSKQIASLQPDEKLYLKFEKSQSPARYVFSANNEPTSLWMTAESQGQEAHITLAMKNEQGEIVSEPSNLAHFKLTEKEFIRHGGGSWDIGSWHVDGSLFVRQKAKWYGPDHFLDQHGGDEYKNAQGKQRIEFGEGDQAYTVFVNEGDCLIWQKDRWQEVTIGPDSLGHPLLLIKKVDERLMAMELWDVAGKGKVVLNLLKSMEPWMAQNGQIIQNMFKFVGARTRSKYVFEVNQERILLSPQDWLVYLPADGGWKKLETAEAIDDYVQRKTQAALFVFEGIAKAEGQQVVQGKLFTPFRSEFKVIELPIPQGGGGIALSAKSSADDEDDDDDEEYDEKVAQQVIKKNSVPSKTDSSVKKL